MWAGSLTEAQGFVRLVCGLHLKHFKLLPRISAYEPPFPASGTSASARAASRASAAARHAVPPLNLDKADQAAASSTVATTGDGPHHGANTTSHSVGTVVGVPLVSSRCPTRWVVHSVAPRWVSYSLLGAQLPPPRPTLLGSPLC